jgi:CRISPR-associated protein Cas1
MTSGLSLKKQGEAICVWKDGAKIKTIPQHHLHGVVCFGDIWVSPELMYSLTENGISIAYLNFAGKFLSRVVGPRAGNVHLRIAQVEYKSVELARLFILAKITNSRTFLRRRFRETNHDYLEHTSNRLLTYISDVKQATDIETILGIEGIASREYFGNVWKTISHENDIFVWNGRNKRPPLDPINAVLSFVYTLIMFDCLSALETVGLDPQIGFLHSLRSGRPALALDMMEEFRAFWGDRLVLSLINRKQLQEKHFDFQVSGAVLLNDNGRRVVIDEYQNRKKLEITHIFLQEKTTVGLLPLLQARLLARYLRGDIDTYPPYFFT